MNLNLLKTSLLAVAICCGGGVSEALADTTDDVIFTEDFSGETYKVSWGGVTGAGIVPSVVDGALNVANGSQSGDRGAYVSFGDNAYAGSAVLKFDMAINKSGYENKNNTAYIFPESTDARYPDATNAVVTIIQDYKGYITVNGKALGTSAYSGITLSYEVYLDATNKYVETVVKNGGTELANIKSQTKATGIGAFHLTFNRSYGAYTIDNISLSKYTPTTTTHNYVVNAKCGDITLKELEKSVAAENAQYTISGLPYAIEKDNVLYKLSDESVANFQKTFTMGTSDAEETVSYAVANDIDYFFEAENILSNTYGDDSKAYYSSGVTAGVCKNASLTMSSIKAGVYTVTVNTTVRKNGADVFTVQVSSDNTTWSDVGTLTLTDNVGGDFSYTGITLPSDGAIRLVESANKNTLHRIDYVTLTKTAETVSLPTEHIYSTYCSDVDLDFTGVTGVEAYKVKVSGNKAVATKIEGKVKAGEGILLKKIDNRSVAVPTTTVDETEAQALADNDLVGATEDISDWSDLNAYMLVSDTQFQKIGEGTLAKGKAYLKIEQVNAVNSVLSIYFGDIEGDDTVTAISGVEEKTTAQADAIYTLQGVKVEKTEKGIYIINGKKVLVK